jgi:3-aminobutyryl-CoA ammonia-lyase
VSEGAGASEGVRASEGAGSGVGSSAGGLDAGGLAGGLGADPRVGLTVTHRKYVKYGDAHYGGGLVDGAYVLGLFGDVATEACVRTDGDEGLFASYSDVQFQAPVLAGDVLEASCTVTAVGRRSRKLSFEARVVCRADPSRGPSAAAVLDPPVIVVTASGTVVVP